MGGSDELRRWEEEQKLEAERELERRGWGIEVANPQLTINPVEEEERIKKKKEELSQTLNAQYQKNIAEANRLAVVRKELASLDNLLQVDITSLRKKIDSVDRDLNEAREVYVKKEKEYAL